MQGGSVHELVKRRQKYWRSTRGRLALYVCHTSVIRRCYSADPIIGLAEDGDNPVRASDMTSQPHCASMLTSTEICQSNMGTCNMENNMHYEGIYKRSLGPQWRRSSTTTLTRSVHKEVLQAAHEVAAGAVSNVAVGFVRCWEDLHYSSLLCCSVNDPPFSDCNIYTSCHVFQVNSKPR